MLPPVKTSCLDHEGSGAVKVQLWDGNKWKAVTPGWIYGDTDFIRKMVEERAADLCGGEEDHAARLRQGRLN